MVTIPKFPKELKPYDNFIGDKIMEQFEKWWDKNIQPSKRVHDCSCAYTSMEIAWKAALEWAISYDDGPCSFRRCNVAERIEEELGDG